MGNNDEKSTELKRSKLQELQGEFHKITWPDRKSLIKMSILVMVSAIILGGVIACLDLIVNAGMKLIIG